MSESWVTKQLPPDLQVVCKMTFSVGIVVPLFPFSIKFWIRGAKVMPIVYMAIRNDGGLHNDNGDNRNNILSASGRFYSQEYPWICQELSKKYCWKIDGYWWGLLTTTNNTEFFCQRELPWINRELREILIYPRITQMDTDWCPQADGLVRQKGTILHPHEADCRHAVDY